MGWSRASFFTEKTTSIPEGHEQQKGGDDDKGDRVHNRMGSATVSLLSSMSDGDGDSDDETEEKYHGFTLHAIEQQEEEGPPPEEEPKVGFCTALMYDLSSCKKFFVRRCRLSCCKCWLCCPCWSCAHKGDGT